MRAPATITDVVIFTSRAMVAERSDDRLSVSVPVRLPLCYDHRARRRPPFLASALVTAIDHVGIAVPDLDAAIAWYHDNLGMIVVHEEINAEQGVREAMLSVRAARGGSTQLQLIAPLDETSTIAKFIDKRGPAFSSWPTGSATSTPSARGCTRTVCACSTRPRGAAPRTPASTSSTPRTPEACWSNWSSPPNTDLPGPETVRTSDGWGAAMGPVGPARVCQCRRSAASASSLRQTTTWGVPAGIRGHSRDTGRP